MDKAIGNSLTLLNLPQDYEKALKQLMKRLTPDQEYSKPNILKYLESKEFKVRKSDLNDTRGERFERIMLFLTNLGLELEYPNVLTEQTPSDGTLKELTDRLTALLDEKEQFQCYLDRFKSRLESDLQAAQGMNIDKTTETVKELDIDTLTNTVQQLEDEMKRLESEYSTIEPYIEDLLSLKELDPKDYTPLEIKKLIPRLRCSKLDQLEDVQLYEDEKLKVSALVDTLRLKVFNDLI